MTHTDVVMDIDVDTTTADIDLHACLEELAQQLVQRGWMMATAESCTGGLIAAACTELPGSSRWFDRGFVTYSNAAKTEMLGVPAELIAQHGAVSEPVARAMALGAAQRAGVQVAVAVTGIAGPDGGTEAKPVGTVWIGISINEIAFTHCVRLFGNRQEVRIESTNRSIFSLIKLFNN